MGENRTGGGTDFWRAGEEPVRPVRAIKTRDEDERGTKEVKKTSVKEKKVKFTPTEEAEKGEKALSREDKRQYHDAVNEERRMEEDGEKRESRDTGGSSASDQAAAPQPDQEEEEGRTPRAMTVPEGPSTREREDHELTHIPYRSWCEHCVRSRPRRRAH